MDNYYELHAQEFFDGTVNADMTENYNEFLKYMPEKGRILDAGCGSGRDSLMFKLLGYNVTSIDGSFEMCKLASKHIKQEVLHMQFQEINFKDEFNGIWACASLLHVSSSEIEMVLNKLKDSLKDEGIIYASFKYGDYEGNRNGRYFNDFKEETAINLFKKVNFNIINIWITNDSRPERQDEQWVNILAQK